jgi:diguanylate cyclase (GGDEF)-like protein
MHKLVEQLDLDWKAKNAEHSSSPIVDFSEEKATLLFIIDTFSRHLIETETNPARRVREALDEFAKEIIKSEPDKLEKVLFRFRQYFNSLRIDEYSYVQKTFDDFRGIVWDFVDQLSEDLAFEMESDSEMRESLMQLKEAVEANSIESLKVQSRQFIDSYTEYQTKKERRRNARMDHFKKNLDSMKRELSEAHNSLRIDHLTKAFNRKCFEEQAKNLWNLNSIYDKPVTLIMLDIDYFKRINDTYGHDIGDCILQECVKMLKEVFPRDVDSVSRLGGEEFAVLLPDYQIEHAVKKAEEALKKFRSEAFVKEDMRVSFTISMGIAELQKNEPVETWWKRADTALYDSKHGGRDRYTVAPPKLKKNVA